MALVLLEFLERNARRAAVVSRAGADLSRNRFRNPGKQKFTHTGLVWKSSRDGLWRFKHVLNVCAGPSSEIFVQSVVQFFDDEPFYYDIHVAVPSEKLQEGIAAVLEDEAASRRLHNPRYSNVANPYRAEFQNSNGWVLAIVAAAQSVRTTVPELQAHYRRAGYVASRVKVGFPQEARRGIRVERHAPRPPAAAVRRMVRIRVGGFRAPVSRRYGPVADRARDLSSGRLQHPAHDPERGAGALRRKGLTRRPRASAGPVRAGSGQVRARRA